MPTVALTGNFGMGKSSVLKMFKELGAFTFDVDSFVHDILTVRPVINRLRNILGEEIIVKKSGVLSIHKKRVAEIIFSNPEKRIAVEAVIHPRVLKRMKQTESSVYKKDPSAVIMFEVPLLYESGYDKFFDTIIVVWCSRASAVSRLHKKGISAEEVMRRLKTQMPITRKMALADIVINNNDSPGATRKRAAKIYRSL